MAVTAGLGAVSEARADDRDAIEADREERNLDTLLDLEDWVEEFGGMEAIREAIVPLRDEVTRVFEGPEIPGLGRWQVEDHRFNRSINSAAVLSSWDTDFGDEDPVNVVIDFDRKLKELGIDLLFIPVPSKIDCYYSKFGVDLPERFPVSPGRIEAIQRLIDADVEVVDVLPYFWEAMVGGVEYPMYEVSGHHQSAFGSRLAGEVVAERLERYEFAGRDKDSFMETRRNGGERVDPSFIQKVWQVLRSDGSEYEHVPDSEVIVIGDSNAFAYSTASWASHIARASGLPITDISESSGGAEAHIKLANMGLESVKLRKAVVWIVTGSQLTRFPWKPCETIPERPTMMGLVNQGDIDGAVEAFHRDFAKDPASVEFDESDANEMAFDLLREGKVELARKLFEVIVIANPFSANAHDSLGECLVSLGQSDLAEEHLQEALTLAPMDTARNNSIRLLNQMGIPPKTVIPHVPAPEILQRWVGNYRYDVGLTGEFVAEGATLRYSHEGGEWETLVAIRDHVFRTENGRFRLVFEAAEDSDDARVVIRWSGRRIEGTRTLAP